MSTTPALVDANIARQHGWTVENTDSGYRLVARRGSTVVHAEYSRSTNGVIGGWVEEDGATVQSALGTPGLGREQLLRVLRNTAE